MLNLKNFFFALLCLTSLTNQNLISGDGSAFGKPIKLSEEELLKRLMISIGKKRWHEDYMSYVEEIDGCYNALQGCFHKGFCITDIYKLEKNLYNLQSGFIYTITESINKFLAYYGMLQKSYWNIELVKNQLLKLLSKLIVNTIRTSALTQTYINAIKINNFNQPEIAQLTGRIVIAASHAIAQLNREEVLDRNLERFFEELQTQLLGIAEEVAVVYPVQSGKRSYRGSPRRPRTTGSFATGSSQRSASADGRGRVRPLAPSRGSAVVPTIQLTPGATQTAPLQRSASRSRSPQASALHRSDASTTRPANPLVARALF